MLIAAATTGNPTSKVNDRLDEVMERLHADYHEQLESFLGDVSPFVSVLPMLESCLTTETGASTT